MSAGTPIKFSPCTLLQYKVIILYDTCCASQKWLSLSNYQTYYIETYFTKLLFDEKQLLITVHITNNHCIASNALNKI